MCSANNENCTWNDAVDICIPNEPVVKEINCSLLSKPVCDKYCDETDNNIVVDAPCFYNGPDDTVDTFCVSKELIKSCSDIQVNEIILYNEEEKQSCLDAHVLINSSFLCGWVWNDSKYLCEDSFFSDVPGSFLYVMV
jgi:hypothetical protein